MDVARLRAHGGGRGSGSQRCVEDILCLFLASGEVGEEEMGGR